MNLSEKFRRFAAECEAMSKFARSPEIKLPGTRWQQDGFCSLNWRMTAIPRRSTRRHAAADGHGTI